MGRPSETRANWIVSSIFLSFVFLALTAVEFLALGIVSIDLESRPFQDPMIYDGLTLREVLVYLAAVFVHAVVWGVFSGIFNRFSPCGLLYSLGLSDISPEDTVFNAIMAESFPDMRENVPWLRITSESRSVIGRLSRASHRIDADKPFEVFLLNYSVEYFEPRKSVTCAPPKSVGGYFRVDIGDAVEVFSAPGSWLPNETQTTGDRGSLP